MPRMNWTNLVGLVSALLTLLFWLLAALSLRTVIHFPGEVNGVIVSSLVATALAAIATAKGSRWWLLAVVAALGTLIAIGIRLH
jgi:hypothetical protein